MTLLVRDEQDVIAHHLRFHLARGVDHIVVTNNLSADGTLALVQPFVEVGQVTLLHEMADTYDQGRWVTRMARLAATELEADWVINSDADEFWWPRVGDLRTTLASVPAAIDVVVAHRHDLSPVAGTGPFYERMRWREIRSTNLLGRPLPPKVCHRASTKAEIHQGNHGVDGLSGGSLDDGRLEILHLPMRSYEQLHRKISLGAAAYARNAALPLGMGDAWRQMGLVADSGGLEQAYKARELEEQSVADAVAAGTHIEDLRLRQAMRQLEEGT